ncbi:dihydrodipicolinate synthase family protein [Acuticoccus mangrovi]|uniref:Dihydrodipicolinate synthase family protein n=1 Tax=Acuticoccus mangrovi TaxID=2796142 RepID=A0A934IQ23_9HYPH|nr:dihydrodipicolinate synthase family protein [Acuticoccus mangrovi]MBJ3777977.1 dihydrodipicolinate synthase family protein [Acuticoccus mangrovi]
MTAPIPFPDPKGVIAACILPFEDDHAIAEQDYRSHLRYVAALPGLAGVAQVDLEFCEYGELERVVDILVEEVGGRLPIAFGVHPAQYREAARLARMAADKGASALIVRPPRSMGREDPALALRHFESIADASGLPLVVYQFPVASGISWPIETLRMLVDKVPSIRAIKDFCNDPALHQRNIRTFQSLPRPVNIITAHSNWLMASLVMGASGLCSSVGSVISELQIALFEAVQRNDMAAARAINDRIVPITQTLYELPTVNLHTGCKEALLQLGRIRSAAVRPPVSRLDATAVARIHAALETTGLLHKEPVHG